MDSRAEVLSGEECNVENRLVGCYEWRIVCARKLPIDMVLCSGCPVSVGRHKSAHNAYSGACMRMHWQSGRKRAARGKRGTSERERCLQSCGGGCVLLNIDGADICLYKTGSGPTEIILHGRIEIVDKGSRGHDEWSTDSFSRSKQSPASIW